MRRLLVLAVLALLAMAQPAAAHGDELEFEVLDATPDDTGSAVTYRVRVTYANDGDPVGGATVYARASRVGEAPLPPVTFDAEPDGVYAGTVTFPAPGEWSVRFEDAEAEFGVTATYTVEEPPPPTTAPPTPTSEAGPVTSTATDPGLVDEDDGGDDGPPAGLVVGLVVTGLLVVGVGVALLVRRRRGP